MASKPPKPNRVPSKSGKQVQGVVGVTVQIKAEDGVSNPSPVVPLKKQVKLRAVVSGGIAGTYHWTYGGAKITLRDSRQYTVTVIGKDQISTGGGEEIKLKFKSNDGKNEAEVAYIIKVIKVTFSASATQNYGYDDMDNAAGKTHHVSVKKNDNTTVRVKITGGANGDVLKFTSEDDSIVKATPPVNPGSSFDLTIEGKAADKDEKSIYARAMSDTGPIAATLKVNVYKKIEKKTVLAQIYDSKSAGASLSGGSFNTATAKTEINKWYKVAVVGLDLKNHGSAGSDKDIEFDLNKNGALDIAPKGNSDEEKKIISKFTSAEQRIAIVKKMNYIYYTKTAASSGDTTITLKDTYSDVMAYFDPDDACILGTGAKKENVTIKSISGTTVTFDSALTNNHAKDESFFLPITGVKGDIYFIVESGRTEAKIRETIGHECGHGFFKWDDVDDLTNLMNYHGGRTATKLRYKGVPKKREAGNENQWDLVSR